MGRGKSIGPFTICKSIGPFTIYDRPNGDICFKIEYGVVILWHAEAYETAPIVITHDDIRIIKAKIDANF